MQVLNLSDFLKSDIKYRISKFPDGELQITLGRVSFDKLVRIICRITNADELFILGQVTDILNRHGVRFEIVILYLMGMRMDRVMDSFRPVTLKVVSSFINNLGTSSIIICEPHSIKSVEELQADAFYPQITQFNESVQRVFPDKGAVEREELSPNDLIFEKVRDLDSGSIKSLKLTNPEKIQGKTFYIKDDLCDGGGTFVGIAKTLKEFVPDAKLYISVCHMVNPKGIENLSANYDHVWFTNSYKNWENLPENVTQVDITDSWQNSKIHIWKN